jgi:hypothetical protein
VGEFTRISTIELTGTSDDAGSVAVEAAGRL